MDGSYISMAMRVHWRRRDRYVIGVYVSSPFESSHSCDGVLRRLRITIGPMRDDLARNKYVREFTFLRKAAPGGLGGRRERFSPFCAGQLADVEPPAEADGDGAGAVPGAGCLVPAMNTSRASRAPDTTGPASRTCAPLDSSERLTFEPPLRTT